jgi:hypothetical protein
VWFYPAKEADSSFPSEWRIVKVFGDSSDELSTDVGIYDDFEITLGPFEVLVFSLTPV